MSIPGQFVKLNVGLSLFVAPSQNLMMSAECTTLTVLALTYVEKYWIVKIFANLMNDAQFAKIFPNNACKYGETTTEDLFTLTLLSHLPNVYKFVMKNTLITVIFWTLYVGKNGGVEFGKLLSIKQIVRNILMNLMTACSLLILTDYCGFIRPLRTGSHMGIA